MAIIASAKVKNIHNFLAEALIIGVMWYLILFKICNGSEINKGFWDFENIENTRI